LSADAFQVFTLLVELFIEKYPTPATDWEPDELLTFSSDSLTRIMEDSNMRTHEYTWWQHWKKLTNQTDLSQDTFDLGMAQLAHMELIGFLDEVEGQDIFFIGKNLTWYIRGIVWWDKGFMLSNKINNTQFIVIAASALFVIITEGENDFSIFNVDGITLQKYLKKYIDIALDPSQEEITSKEVGFESLQANFCSQCGNKLTEGAKFCSKCGHKI
jgi:ribosomal protein L40E